MTAANNGHAEVNLFYTGTARIERRRHQVIIVDRDLIDGANAAYFNFAILRIRPSPVVTILRTRPSAVVMIGPMSALNTVTLRRIRPLPVVTMRRIRASPVVKAPCPMSTRVISGGVSVNVESSPGIVIVIASVVTLGAVAANVESTAGNVTPYPITGAVATNVEPSAVTISAYPTVGGSATNVEPSATVVTLIEPAMMLGA